ncbi:MAG: hypothetical protein LBQ61_03255 [Spirochaetales bacterium]|nr:hypothetical protein [Spirochaetales bacterium]
MKFSKLMKERIRRVKVLFAELGYEVYEDSLQDDSYSAAFERDGEFAGGFMINGESKFLEIAFAFSFSTSLSHFLQSQLEKMIEMCYTFGCYLSVQKEEDLSFSVFSKIYFAGLNYYALKETLRDFHSCIEALKEIIDLNQRAGGNNNGNH